jgi:SAM-dependent methyltransferase
MDAVRRRLLDPSASPLANLIPRIDGFLNEEEHHSERASERNLSAWDALAGDPRFAGGPVPADRDEARGALDEWLQNVPLDGKALLCLGAGGGRQGPLHAAAGARVTVVDISERMLDHDRRAGLQTLCTSMEKLDGLGNASFDFVVQPVSSCYVADLARVHAEVARVLKPGGLYIVQHKQPIHQQVTSEGMYGITLPYVEGIVVSESRAFHREPGTVEYVHTLETLLGGLCRAGFVIEDVTEPPRGDSFGERGSPGLRAYFLPPYLKIKARRR